MDTLMQLVTKGNDFLWSFLLLVLSYAETGLYYTIRLKIYPGQKVRGGRPSGIWAFQHER